jgi:hypothetical protein
MRRRRHYATTGNRASVHVAVELTSDAEVFLRDPAAGPTRSERTRQLLMGDIAQVDDETTVEFAVDIVGSAPIERLDIFDGLEHLETVRPYTEDDLSLSRRLRLVYEGAEYRGRARATSWDGLLRIEGATILRATTINNWNLDRGIQSLDNRQLTWKAVTTGNYGAIDLWLDRPASSLTFETAHVSGRVSPTELDVAPRVFPAGGLNRAVSIQRLPDRMSAQQIKLRRTFSLRARGDTRLYIRAQQEDGHRIWTSPIYLFRRDG